MFPSVEAAERYLEATDVRGGIYPRAFGPSGEQFTITATDGVVVIQPSYEPPDATGLQMLLRRSLAAVGEPAPDAANLLDLVAAAEAFWDERDPYDERYSKSLPGWGCLLAVVSAVALVMFLRR